VLNKVAQQDSARSRKGYEAINVVSNLRRVPSTVQPKPLSADATGVTFGPARRHATCSTRVPDRNEPQNGDHPRFRQDGDRVLFFLVKAKLLIVTGDRRGCLRRKGRQTQQNGHYAFGARSASDGAFIAIDNHCDPHLQAPKLAEISAYRPEK
jgi:hypothetical protein